MKSVKKFISYIISIIKYFSLTASIILMLLSAFLAYLYFFMPSNYAWTNFINSNRYLTEIIFGEFREFLKITSLIFFAGITEYILFVFLKRFSLTFRLKA